MTVEYPTWIYYPNRTQPPLWVQALLAVVRDQQNRVESAKTIGLTSDTVLSYLAPGLASIGYTVETGKKVG